MPSVNRRACHIGDPVSCTPQLSPCPVPHTKSPPVSNSSDLNFVGLIEPWQPTPLHHVCGSYKLPPPPPPQRPLHGEVPHPHEAVVYPILALHTLWAECPRTPEAGWPNGLKSVWC